MAAIDACDIEDHFRAEWPDLVGNDHLDWFFEGVRFAERRHGVDGTVTSPGERVATPAEMVATRAKALAADARRLGLVLMITQRPLQPLAMGHHEDVVEVREVRHAPR